MAKVFCGQCGNEFASPEKELEHVCEVTGVKPTDPASMGPNYQKIQEAALERGLDENTPEAEEGTPASTSDVKRESGVTEPDEAETGSKKK